MAFENIKIYKEEIGVYAENETKRIIALLAGLNKRIGEKNFDGARANLSKIEEMISAMDLRLKNEEKLKK